HPRALVRREPPSEADREGLRRERVLELLEDGWRLTVAGELGPQPATGEDGQLALLAEVRFPQLAGRDSRDPLPPAPGRRRGLEVVEVGVQVALEELPDRPTHPRRQVDPVRD